MINNGILKNVNKFSDIKLARGIDLTHANVMYRKKPTNQSNVSMQKYGHVWFRLTRGNAIFKTYDGVYKPELKKLRIVNELIVQKLAKQIGVPCATYEPASFYDDMGLVTYNFLKENQTLIPLADFLIPNADYDNNLVDIADACAFYQMLGYDIKKEEIILDMYKDMVLDALTLQTDRNNYNINLLKDNNDYSMSVSILFDNEFAYAIDTVSDLVKKGRDINSISILEILDEYSVSAKTLNVQDEMFKPRRYQKNVQNLVNLAKSNPQMLNFLKNALKNLSISKAIERVEASGVEISSEYKEYLTRVTRFTKMMFTRELKKPITEDTTYLYDEFIK